MKILLLIETLLTGGAETFVLRLANGLSERHDVILAVMHGHRIERGLLDQLSPRVRVEALRLPAERWLWRLDGTLRRLKVDASLLRLLQRAWLRAIIRREQPDVVHSHLLKADRLAAQSRSAAPSVRHVTTMHGDYAPYLQGHANPFMLKGREWMATVLAGADAVIAICQDHLEHLRSDFPEARGKLSLIYNGYSLPPRREEVRLPTDKFLFGMVSRGVEQKGWSVAVEAFRLLDRSDARLVLVGDGPAIQRLRREKPEGVIFCGFSARPADWIARFDVCLLPTLFPHESLPTVVIEYLALGKPVVASDVGEIPLMLKAPDGAEAGRLVPFHGKSISADALASAMKELMDNEALRRSMADAASASFPRFRMDRCIAAHETIYRGEPSTSSTSASH